ncbi:MAG: class II fumarate hydratase [Clostridia bacterium]|nr:class II fumarate hydratase [Clostridia bacterium]
MEYRIEKDSIGEIEVPAENFWGAQTERSRINFQIGKEKMPSEIIAAFAKLKSACAKANFDFDKISKKQCDAIVDVCKEIENGTLAGEFPLVVWQTGSGTQTNMNVNEVIANRANKKTGEKLLHPNDTVNCSQSSNDTYPSAMRIAFCREIERLIPAAEQLRDAFYTLEKENEGIIKIGRTHLQDAVPLTFSQEISGWRSMLDKDIDAIKQTEKALMSLAIGGTAVGTGLNAPENFGDRVAEYLKAETGIDFSSSDNKFRSLTSLSDVSVAHGALTALASDLMKIANDIRLLSSGPRSGIGEIFIPENEPGSSIMPGKVNPTQCEMVTMVAVRVMGNDTSISVAASQGNFQLNVFLPVTAYSFLQSTRLLTDAMHSFNKNCVSGIKANTAKMQENLNRSLMLVTALNGKIGYEKAAEVAKKAYKENLTLAEACESLGFLSKSEAENALSPDKMIRSSK